MSEAIEELEPTGGKASSAIGKGFAVLRALRVGDAPMTLTAVAAAVGIAASSAHSVLNQLLEEDAVVQDDEKRYRLGPELLYLGAAFARSTRAYRAVWIELVNASNELSVTAALAVPWDGHHLVLNAHRAPNSDVAVPFGGRVPLDAASWGKTYYSSSGAALPDHLDRYTDASIVDLKRFKEELKVTAAQGYAVDDEEFHQGVGGVCAAVTSQSGYEGLVSFLAPISRVREVGFETLGRRLTAIAARASLSLGDGSRLRFFGVE